MRWKPKRGKPKTHRPLAKPDTSHLRRSGRYIPPSRPTWRDKLIAVLKSPFIGLEQRVVEPFASFLENADLFRILEKLGFLVAVIVFLLDISVRRENSIYQAWQVVKDGKGEKSGVVVLALERLKRENFSLSGINVKDTNLSDADLSNANLRGAYLTGAYLTSAYLGSANLNIANLSSANLNGAYLTSAYLGSANLNIANLTGANLSSANLNGAYLTSAYLGSANLNNANLSGANLIGANLIGAKGLTPEQVKVAKNWRYAFYDPDFRKKLGLPPEPPGKAGSNKSTP